MNEILKQFLRDLDLSPLHGKISEFMLKELCHVANRAVGRKCPLCGE